MGLAAVYEQEYLRRSLGVAPDDPGKAAKVSQEMDEVRRIMVFLLLGFVGWALFIRSLDAR